MLMKRFWDFKKKIKGEMTGQIILEIIDLRSKMWAI